LHTIHFILSGTGICWEEKRCRCHSWIFAAERCRSCSNTWW